MASKSIRSTSRRSPSLSSLPSMSSNSSLGSMYCDSPISPTTPLRYFGIPFSWEQFPGIPKKSSFKKKDPSQNLLPLPPSGNSISIPSRSKDQLYRKETSPMLKKYNTTISDSFRKDPFFAAFVECSKDDEEAEGDFDRKSSNKVTRAISDRLGFVGIYTSCKRTCAVSESIVYLPRSRTHYL